MPKPKQQAKTTSRPSNCKFFRRVVRIPPDLKDLFTEQEYRRLPTKSKEMLEDMLEDMPKENDNIERKLSYFRKEDFNIPLSELPPKVRVEFLLNAFHIWWYLHEQGGLQASNLLELKPEVQCSFARNAKRLYEMTYASIPAHVPLEKSLKLSASQLDTVLNRPSSRATMKILNSRHPENLGCCTIL